jgi:hypothetical protein
MKEDKLEHFVRNNTEEFNELEPPDMVWQKLEKELPFIPKSTIRKIWPYAWKAAAAVLIFASAWLLKDYTDHRRHSPQTSSSYEATSNPQLGELSDAEAYYASKISSKQAELALYAHQHPEIIEDLKKEFKEMDKNKDELKKDLAESNADEKVIEAIILSYRVKLEILDQMLTELHKTKETSSKPISTNL